LEPHKIQLIITCITDHITKKKLQDSVKTLEAVKLSYPSPKEAFVYLLNELGDKIEGKEERLLELLQKYKGCIRDAMLHLDNPDDVGAIGCSFKDMNQFEIIKALFGKSEISLDDMKYIIHNDVSNIAYLMFENVPEELCHNRITTSPTNIYLKILESFSKTAEIETFAFNTSDWRLYDAAHMIRMGIMRQTLNSLPSKPIASRKDVQLRFTQLLSKMSHKNIFGKRLEHIRDKTMLNYEKVIKNIEIQKGLKKNTDESNIQVTYMKYFSDDK